MELKIPILTGPSGSGKSQIIHDLGNKIPISIISADSRQVVRGFDIGSGKPSPKERSDYDYHLLDLIDPGEKYSAYRFAQDAESAIGSILARKRIPIICGGTGLYIRALTEGIMEIESDNSEIRIALEEELRNNGPEELFRALKVIDPDQAEKIHPNNIVKVMRALEIYRQTGKTKTGLAKSGDNFASQYSFSVVGLLPATDILYQAINLRVEKMLDRGWMAEIQGLIEKWGEDKIRSSKAIGYSELVDGAKGDREIEGVLETIKMNTRRFAKRQKTWLRGSRDTKIVSEPSEAGVRINQILARFQSKL